ncbi:hypothetical protein [Turicibacter sanguinis]|uniref:hypothetical protein n=1 Tax=Turicibacter sanguinis TaxID=154288 RepID=UPI001E573ED4|nr:hypothetical protein [Turicibacter sanguinis]MDB8565294.1 hypothetical protein [Turicibacter sanguinis]MDB8568046.1 hypothetical protein [Turicibacter sanguinis]MDB8570795.1 hypothetical protein [Turicibacter sanguinis]MDB8579554.1 hypothetical protein [Turicibacter sanguinis]
MQAYLFVHFREKSTPDGEQVHFGLSKDGFHWEAVNQVTGPYTRIEKFDECMADLATHVYEAPTAVCLEDGKWCLFLDYYGVRGAG